MKKLRELRKSKNISMKDLGKQFGLSESTISLYETGKRDADIDTIIKLATYFNVSTDYLLGKSNVKNWFTCTGHHATSTFNTLTEAEVNMTFGNRLKQLRREHDLTQSELAQKLNLSKSNISKYESGFIEPNGESLKSISKLFNVSTDYLLGNSDSRLPTADTAPASPSSALQEIEKILNDADTPQSEKDDLFQRFTQIYFLSKEKNEKK